MKHEPISSIVLMERAAKACFTWLKERNWQDKTFHLFCGKGNNGGDGLAIARLLLEQGFSVFVYLPFPLSEGSASQQTNLQRLQGNFPQCIHPVTETSHFPSLSKDSIIIDALFGTGLKAPLSGLVEKLAEHLNHSPATIVSIDIPSGLFTDETSAGNVVVNATFTLTFQCFKQALLVQENGPYTGKITVLDIGLHPDFPDLAEPKGMMIDPELIKGIYIPRDPFAHKGKYGHALIAGGSYGKMGAITLSASACLRSGAGLVSAWVPSCGYSIIQTSLPEAMVMTDPEFAFLSSVPEELEKYSVTGVGPGMGTAFRTATMLDTLLSATNKPVVMDADALNIIATDLALLTKVPANSVLTPHPKEFDRLFGDHANDFARQETALRKAKELNLVIVLKGHHTLVASTFGKAYYNTTGNAGMAKGGSGDVLTGIITGLIAQNYPPLHAAILGVYLHGLAGDEAAKEQSQESMLATDLVGSLPAAFRQIAAYGGPSS
jgi:hydroxyethylthiazole kinase-like uncharacterized protein yjeF